MIRIDIRPVWRFRGETDKDFDFLLVALLEAIERTGKLTHAARVAGISYRHSWNLIEQWQAFFGAPLVEMRKGRGTTLTTLGADLLWASLRARERLAPELENLSAEFARTLNAALSETASVLSIQASHDFAVARLPELTAAAGLAVDVQYKGSFDALGALRRGECDVAGFHLPEGELGSLLARRYAEGLEGGDYRFIRFAARTQGFIVRSGNPKEIRAIGDLARRDVRMINRQRGSGTRALLEFLLSREGIDRTRVQGYDTDEITHAAVAVMIAGGQADVGFGVQAAAAQYNLDFIACCQERYGLAVRASQVDSPPIQALVQVLRGEAFASLVAALPGYSAPGAGEIAESPAALAHDVSLESVAPAAIE
jgi:molybdate transport repressor ModE-like protein